MSDNPVTLEFLARQQARLLDEMASFRDDMTVLTAIVIRIDGTLTALLAENRAVHSQHARLANRVRALEGAP